MASRSESSYSDLVFNIFRYAIEQLSKNNIDAIIELGFSVEEISKISNLTLSDVRRLSDMSQHFLPRLNIDHDCFSRMVERLEQAKGEEDLQDELIKLGAPHAMMNELFGMNGHEYAQRRKLLSLTRVGRPPIPSEEEQIMIYDAWRRYESLDEPNRWLKLGQELGINLTTVWPLVKSWDKLDSAQPERKSTQEQARDDYQQWICA